ncbi:MAG: DUF3710 domain-containing protein [Actinomycetota bacterium]|nr:DUF3710 domain-containing protein [Actinomycetota bacterium]
MGIFRRRDKSDDDRQVSGSQGIETSEASETAAGVEATDPEAIAETAGPAAEALDELDGLDEEPLNRARGPFDVTEVEAAERDGGVARLDLGALRLVPVEGMQLRLEIDEAQQTVLSVHAVLQDSSVQLQAFAAPRTVPVWPEIRTEIADNVTAGGGTADVVVGELGRELLCRMAQQGPDGRTVFAQVRFAGVDGPRWFLRAVFSGPAAIDEEAAAPLVALVRSVVVVRGDDAMPPREVLPLTLPQDAQQEGAGEAPHDEAADEVGTDGTHLDDLKPFDRGPEITEVR